MKIRTWRIRQTTVEEARYYSNVYLRGWEYPERWAGTGLKNWNRDLLNTKQAFWQLHLG